MLATIDDCSKPMFGPFQPTSKMARDTKSKYYFTGIACNAGHVFPRYTSGQACVVCIRMKYKIAASKPGFKELKNASRREAYANDATLRESIRDKRNAHRSTPEFWVSRNAWQRNKRENDPEYREKINAYGRERNARPEVKLKKKEADAARYLLKKQNAVDDSWRRRDYHRQYMRDRLASDPKFRLSQAFSGAVRRCLASGKGGDSWSALLGYTVDDLRAHLQGLFLPGMTWENYGEWHIDHVIPVSAHNFEKPEDIDFKRCWALTNLQPLWAVDNIKKGAKLAAPFQPSLALGIPANDNTPRRKAA